jgi:S1-C subfamily serine protease
VIINGNDFGDYPGVADYQLTTGGGAGLPKPGKLGVSIIDDSRAGSSGGVLISGLTTGSAAQEAGIALGDRIVGLNGTKVSNVLELKSIMFDKQPGERMRVMVQRGMDTRKELQFEVVLR